MSLKDYLITLTLENAKLTPEEKAELVAEFCNKLERKC